MPGVRFLVSVLLVLIALPTRADTFYVCRKRGMPNAWVNQGTVKTYRRQGYQCRSRMAFQDTPRPARRTYSDSAPPARSHAPAGSPARTFDTRGSRDTGPRRLPGRVGAAESYEAIIQEASERFNVPGNLIRAVIRVESNFHPQAVSSAGAQGLMQLMPGTARHLGVTDPFDARQNIMGGTRYLRMLANRFKGNPKLTLAAYHAGPNVVAARGGIPYEATERYVRNVLYHYLRYKASRL